MANEHVRGVAVLIVDTFVTRENDADLETAFGPDRRSPSPELRAIIAEHAQQHGLKADDQELVRLVREEFERRLTNVTTEA